MSVRTIADPFCNSGGMTEHFLGDQFHILQTIYDNLPQLLALPGLDSYGVSTIHSREELKALVGDAGKTVFLQEGERSGFFTLRAGSSQDAVDALCAGDILEGIYIASGLGGHYWERMWDRRSAQPEWWGAVSGYTGNNINDKLRASLNLLAFNESVGVARITQLKGEAYLINDVWWINKHHAVVQGTNAAIEDGIGTQIIQLDRTKTVIRVGGTGMNDLRRRIRVEHIGVSWEGGPIPTPAAIDAPRGFDMRYCLSFELVYPFVFNPIVGYYFYGNIASFVIKASATRFAKYGMYDFYRGYWCGGGGPGGIGGSLPGFAGQNASLFMQDINGTMGGDALNASVQDLPAVGLYADGDFADLFVSGFETSGVPRSLHLNGTGAVGHWDTRFEKLTFDQGDEDGCILIENLSSMTAIMFQNVYLQFNQGAPNSPSQGSNRGILIQNTGGIITFDNTQILSGGDKTRGIWMKNANNVIFSESCIIKGAAYPVSIDVNCPGATFRGSIRDDGNNGNGQRAAISVTGAVGLIVQPRVQGAPGSYSEGIHLLGDTHTSAVIDPTGIDISACRNGRKTAVNSNKISSPGYYSPNGIDTVTPGTGICVMGITI